MTLFDRLSKSNSHNEVKTKIDGKKKRKRKEGERDYSRKNVFEWITKKRWENTWELADFNLNIPSDRTISLWFIKRDQMIICWRLNDGFPSAFFLFFEIRPSYPLGSFSLSF